MAKHEERAGNLADFGSQPPSAVPALNCNSGLAYPTETLVDTYRRACDLICVGSRALPPESDLELVSIDQLKSTFNRSIRYSLERLVEAERFDWKQIKDTVGPHRRFFHSELVLYQNTHEPAEVSFLAEMNNKNHEWVNLSSFGWIRHSEGPVFTRVRAPLEDPLRYRVDILYSEQAFNEELEAIRTAPMEFVLGLAGRSFLIETALRHIAEHVHPRPVYHSGVSSLCIIPTDRSTAEFRVGLQHSGAFRFNLSLDQETAVIVASDLS